MPRVQIPFIGNTSEANSSFSDYQKTVNFYPEASQGGRGDVTLYPTPGYTVFSDIGLGGMRGAIVFNNKLYAVSGDILYEVLSTGSRSVIGTLSSNIGQVNLAQNGTQIILVDGTAGYIYDDTYSTFQEIKQYATGTNNAVVVNKLTDVTADFVTAGVIAGTVVYNVTTGASATVTAVDGATTLSLTSHIFTNTGETYEVGSNDFPNGATHVEFFDGYFIVNDPSNAGRYQFSASYNGHDWPVEQFATAERSPDELQGLAVNGRELWLIGKETAEPWYNAAAPIVPFEPINNGFSEWGCAAPYSIATNNGTLFWLSANQEGQGQVVATAGLNTQVISTNAIAAEISKFSKIDDAIGFTYTYQRHNFYVLTFPTADRSFVYDTTTQLWHEWSSGGVDKRHVANFHIFFDNRHMVGSSEVGKMLQLDWDKYTEDGENITRLRRGPYIKGDADEFVFHHKVKMDFETGVGNSDDEYPVVMLRWTDDGKTFSNELWRPLGAQGEYYRTVEWRKLGRSKYRAYEVQITDPVKVVLVNAFADISFSARGD